MTPQVIFLILTLTGLLWVLYPLVAVPNQRKLRANNQTKSGAQDHQMLKQQRLFDLEADYELGKLEPNEYTRLKERLLEIEDRSSGSV